MRSVFLVKCQVSRRTDGNGTTLSDTNKDVLTSVTYFMLIYIHTQSKTNVSVRPSPMHRYKHQIR